MHQAVLRIPFRFVGGTVVAHGTATAVVTYQCVANRLQSPLSIDVGMSVECRVDIRNVNAQYPDIPSIMSKPFRQQVDIRPKTGVKPGEGSPWQGVHASENQSGTWTLGSRTGLRMPLNSECDRHADRGTTVRFGHGPHRTGTQFSNLTHSPPVGTVANKQTHWKPFQRIHGVGWGFG